MRHRPIGIGVQGLADAFILMRYPFESSEAQLLNIQIFETIYHAALEASCELAEKLGPYETYAGSPVSKGVSSSHNLPNLSCVKVRVQDIFFSCRFFNMTCGIKLQQIYGTGRHWRRKLPSESSRASVFVVFITWRLQNQDSPLPLPPVSPFVLRHGVKNSLLLAPMPTASTAQILGNNESIEPYTSNIYTRRVLSGEFQVSINAAEYFTVCK